MKNINHGLLVSFLCFFLIVLYISCERTITKGYLSPEAEIHSFSIDSYEAEINGDSISLEFRYGTNIDELQPIIDISKGAKVTPKSGEKQDFSSPVVYKVIAEIGLVKEYTVCVSILPNTESEIEYFMVDDKKANIQGTNIMLLLDSGFKLESIKPTIQLSANASVYPKSGQAIDFNTPQKYTVTAEDGSKTVYTVT
ncbi:MAG: DUF5018 domain-containing protein, partial [Marinifilaceae bacterium]|nr:DUF5018 domain-containing protein [Marinifilaceae bacterium]